MPISLKRTISLAAWSKLDARERYKLQRREERISAKGVSLATFHDSLREDIKRMSAKKKARRPVEKSMGLKSIKSMTPNQQETIEAYEDGYNLLLHGVAGTGKTFLSLWLGLKDVLAGKYNKIVIVRSIVSSRDPGFLPGGPKEKSEVYEAPYRALFSELFGRGDAYEILSTKGVVEFVTTSFIRGTTIRDAIVLVDEFQNMNFQELDTVITRVGQGCKVIFAGDIEQSDLNKPHDRSGLPHFIRILDEIWDEDKPEESFFSVEFDHTDIVRSGLVKNYIKARSALKDQE